MGFELDGTKKICFLLYIYIYIDIMPAAMTHPSRVLNLDMKAKLYMPKSYI